MPHYTFDLPPYLIQVKKPINELEWSAEQIEENKQNEMVEYILGLMELSPKAALVQRVQTRHRLNLAEFWAIEKGSRILEIGCGQGDTTAVLAYLVGEEGLVYGVDIAPPDYGSPFTVGDSAAQLKKSSLGKQISMNFEFDVLSSLVNFPDSHFDMIVFSHSSWYLK